MGFPCSFLGLFSKGCTMNKRFLVSFTLSTGVAHTERVEAVSAILAIRIAHQRIVENTSLADTIAIVCTVID